MLAALAVPAFAAPFRWERDLPPASAKKTPLAAKLEACGTGDGYATFAGTMPAYGPKARMEMRFDLQQKPLQRRRRMDRAYAASRASGCGTALTPASPASSSASASAGFSPRTRTARSSASAGATRAARLSAPPSA